VSAALWQIAQEIKMVEIIDKFTDKTRIQDLTVGEYVLIAVINRCAAPCSKSKLSKWFAKDWLSTQFNIDSKTLNAQTYWNHFQYLDKNLLDSIETALNQTVLVTYHLKLDSLFYDPTNYYTFSKKEDAEGILQFGHSKEGRDGNRLVSYSLLCATEMGIPFMHETYPGNTQDAQKFKDVPLTITNRLNKLGYSPKDITLVFDKGNHSPEAFSQIDKAGFGYIVSARNSTQKELLEVTRENFTEISLPATEKSVMFHKTVRKIYGKERDVYVVIDPKKQKKHTLLFEEKLQETIQEIRDFFKERLNEKKWRDKTVVEAKIASMIGGNPMKSILKYAVSGTYAALQYTLDIDTQAEALHVESLGRTILFTNRTEWTPEAVIWGYREQYVVEHAFKEMKSPTSIAVRPMYHHSNRCIRAHVFVCVLSLLLLSLLRLKLARNLLEMSYLDLLEELRMIRILEISTGLQAAPVYKLETLSEMGTKLVKKLELKRFLAN
jgi:transposase